MRLWTFQDLRAWETLQQRGVLRGDGRRADHWLRDDYRWMMRQMKERLPRYSGHYPLWAWHTPKPDLRLSGYLSSGTINMFITLEIPAERVLLSDYHAWHAVLNHTYLAMNEEDAEAWVQRSGAPLYHDLTPDLRHEVEQSWHRVFDLDNATIWSDPEDRWIQAVVEEIRLDDVIAAREFRAR